MYTNPSLSTETAETCPSCSPAMLVAPLYGQSVSARTSSGNKTVPLRPLRSTSKKGLLVGADEGLAPAVAVDWTEGSSGLGGIGVAEGSSCCVVAMRDKVEESVSAKEGLWDATDGELLVDEVGVGVTGGDSVTLLVVAEGKRASRGVELTASRGVALTASRGVGLTGVALSTTSRGVAAASVLLLGCVDRSRDPSDNPSPSLRGDGIGRGEVVAVTERDGLASMLTRTSSLSSSMSMLSGGGGVPSCVMGTGGGRAVGVDATSTTPVLAVMIMPLLDRDARLEV